MAEEAISNNSKAVMVEEATAEEVATDSNSHTVNHSKDTDNPKAMAILSKAIPSRVIHSRVGIIHLSKVDICSSSKRPRNTVSVLVEVQLLV
jgi:hypothetical protein